MVDRFAQVRNWRSSWIRGLAWHSRMPKLALALRDDSIRIFVNQLDSEVTPFLKAPEQTLVSSLAWQLVQNLASKRVNCIQNVNE
jgi:hypothetical protein